MGCDYYIESELVIEFRDKDGKIRVIHTNIKLQKGYIFSYPDEDSDDDIDTQDKKFNAELERRIQENTYNKILFENEVWIEESYKKNYENYLFKTYKDIVNFIKIYKKYTATKRY
jgi:hypothetical protein